MNEKTGSNIYNYGSRRDDEKTSDFRGHYPRRSRRRRRRQNRMDLVARYVLYFLSAAAVGLAVAAGVWLTGGGNEPRDATPVTHQN